MLCPRGKPRVLLHELKRRDGCATVLCGESKTGCANTLDLFEDGRSFISLTLTHTRASVRLGSFSSSCRAHQFGNPIPIRVCYNWMQKVPLFFFVFFFSLLLSLFFSFGISQFGSALRNRHQTSSEVHSAGSHPIEQTVVAFGLLFLQYDGPHDV